MNGQITDPAWFYSSIAQSSAAIVGLIGAFLAARVIDQLTLMRQHRTRLAHSFEQLCMNVDSLKNRWRTISKYVTEEIELDERAIAEAKSGRSGSRTFELGGSIGSGGDFDPEVHRREMQEFAMVLGKLEPFYSRADAYTEASLASLSAQLHEACRTMADQHSRAVVGSSPPIETIIGELADYKRLLLPRSFLFVLAILGWISFAGIIWPLSVLPGLPHSNAKNLMLAALSVGLLSLIGFIAYQFLELQKLGNFHKASK